jgi:hypothetical protein
MFAHLRAIRSMIMGCLDSALNRMAGTDAFKDIWSANNLADGKRRLDPAFLNEMRWFSLTDEELASITRLTEKHAQKINKGHSSLTNAMWKELDQRHDRRRTPITRSADEVDDLFRSQSWRSVSPWREELAHHAPSATDVNTEKNGPTPNELAGETSVNGATISLARSAGVNPESDGEYIPPTKTTGLADLVTLDQAAALVNRSAAALRHYRKLGMPKPFVHGTKGKPNEYRWDEMRPWLEDTFGRPIPELSVRQFRASRG